MKYLLKKIVFLYLFILCNTLFGQTNSPANIEQTHYKVTSENGIVIYKSAGVEGVTRTSEVISPPVNQSISNWDLQQCNDALYYIGLKIEKSISEDDNESVEKYLEEKRKVLERKSMLTSQPN